MTLRRDLIKLAHANPELRADLLPLLSDGREAAIVPSSKPFVTFVLSGDTLSGGFHFPSVGGRYSTVGMNVKHFGGVARKVLAEINQKTGGSGKVLTDPDLSVESGGARTSLNLVSVSGSDRILWRGGGVPDTTLLRNVATSVAKAHKLGASFVVF